MFRRWIASLLLLAAPWAGAAAADEPEPWTPGPGLREAVERLARRAEVLDEYKASLRRRALAAYRARDHWNGWFHVTQREADGTSTAHRVALHRKGRSMLAVLARVEEGELDVQGLFGVTPGRFAVLSTESEGRMVALGLDAVQATVDRVQAVLDRAYESEGPARRFTQPVRPKIQLACVAEMDGESAFTLGLSMETSKGETPSWLSEETWAPLTLAATAEDVLVLTSAREVLEVDARSGLLRRQVRRHPERGVTAEIRLEPDVDLDDVLERLLARVEAATPDETGDDVDRSFRQLWLQLLLTRLRGDLAKEPGRTARVLALAPDFARAVVDGPLAERELATVCAWGSARIDGLRAAGDADAATIRRVALAEMVAHLQDRWWGGLDAQLPEPDAAADAATDRARLPARGSPLALAMEKAIRAHAEARLLEAWTD